MIPGQKQLSHDYLLEGVGVRQGNGKDAHILLLNKISVQLGKTNQACKRDKFRVKTCLGRRIRPVRETGSG